jgi:hypothetical protein
LQVIASITRGTTQPARRARKRPPASDGFVIFFSSCEFAFSGETTIGRGSTRHRPIGISSRLRRESAVFIGGAEIDVDPLHLVAGEGEEFSIAKPLAVAGDAQIGHERLVALDEDLLEFMPRDPVGVLPAPLEISRLVDVVVIGANEVEIVGERIVDPLAVVGEIGGEDRADDVGFAGDIQFSFGTMLK